MSATVASPIYIKENEPPSLGVGAINGPQTVRMAANNLEDWPFISFLRWRRRELDVASSENLTFDALEYQPARTGAGYPAGFWEANASRTHSAALRSARNAGGSDQGRERHH